MKNMKLIRQIYMNKLEELNRLQLKAEASLKKAPEGTMILSTSNGKTQYYYKTRNTEKKGRYIKKKEQKLIEALAQKDYDLRFCKEVEKQKQLIDETLKSLPELPDIALENIYSFLPAARRQFVRPHILSDEEYIEQWLKEEYTGKEFFEEVPLHITERGERVRSKSEKILADKLFAMGIPYRYEYPLKMKGYGTIYPDFTILKVSSRTEVYLEHFGMMDDPQYCQKAVLKLQTYARNHIYPGKNLLVTFETLQTPLDMKSVEEMLRQFVL